MIEVEAEVVEKIGDSRYRVKPEPQNSCGHCSSKSNCASGAFEQIFPRPRRVLEVQSTQPLTIGQHVVLGMDEQIVQKFAILAYLLPLVGLFLGAMIGESLGNHFLPENNETLSIILGLTGMIPGFLLARIISNRVVSRNTGSLVIRDKSPVVAIDGIGYLQK